MPRPEILWPGWPTRSPWPIQRAAERWFGSARQAAGEPLVLPAQPWLADAKTPPLEAANLRLLYGRWLAQESLFDEAREQLARLQPDDVVAPASLLFYQGVVYHRLLDKEAGLRRSTGFCDGARRCPGATSRSPG